MFIDPVRLREYLEHQINFFILSCIWDSTTINFRSVNLYPESEVLTVITEIVSPGSKEQGRWYTPVGLFMVDTYSFVRKWSVN